MQADLKPGWLAEELNEAALHAAEVEVAAAEIWLPEAKQRAASIVELAQGRLNRAYKERDRARAAVTGGE